MLNLISSYLTPLLGVLVLLLLAIPLFWFVVGVLGLSPAFWLRALWSFIEGLHDGQLAAREGWNLENMVSHAKVKLHAKYRRSQGALGFYLGALVLGILLLIDVIALGFHWLASVLAFQGFGHISSFWFKDFFAEDGPKTTLWDHVRHLKDAVVREVQEEWRAYRAERGADTYSSAWVLDQEIKKYEEKLEDFLR